MSNERKQLEEEERVLRQKVSLGKHNEHEYHRLRKVRSLLKKLKPDPIK